MIFIFLFLTYPDKHNSKRHRYPSVHCSIIYSSKDVEAT